MLERKSSKGNYVRKNKYSNDKHIRKEEMFERKTVRKIKVLKMFEWKRFSDYFQNFVAFLKTLIGTFLILC